MKLLHRGASTTMLTLARMWVFGLWLFIVLYHPLHQLSALPISTFAPAGFLLHYLPIEVHQLLLRPAMLVGLQAALVVSIGLVLWKRSAGATAAVACLLLTVHQGLLRGFGNMDHEELALLYAAYCLTLLPLADRWFGQPRSWAAVRPDVPLVFSVAFMCLAYSFIGVHRLLFGGVELFMSESLSLWIVEGTRRFHMYPWNLEFLVFEQPVVRLALKAGFVVSTLFEATALLVLVSRRYRWAFLAVMSGFHLAVFLFMKILFWHQWCLFLLLLDQQELQILARRVRWRWAVRMLCA